ncbi:MAG: SOS response-associated peptidase family protein [Gemmatimonadota bacterium]
MGGRYALEVSEEELLEMFDVPGLTFEHPPRYNIAPGQLAPVVAEDERGRRMGLLEWGFLPAWKDEPTGAFINAHAESVAPIHDRMPVAVAPEDRDRWLDPSTPPDRLRDVLAGAEDGSFDVREVSTRVNRPDVDDPGLLKPART